MNKFKIYSVAFLALGTSAFAQDFEQARKAIDAEKFDKAKSILKTLTSNNPEEGKNFFILGNVYLTQKIEDSAKIYFDKGLTAKKNPNFNYIGLGQLALDKKDVVKSNEFFNKAQIDMKRKDFEEFLYIGRAYLNAENPNYKSALLFLNKAKAIQPNDAQVLLSLGDAFYGEGNINEAYSAYRNAYDADSSVLRAKLQLGVITKGSKAFQEAKTAFENILSIDTNYGPAYRELAETYYVWSLNDKENYAAYNKKALDYYDKYLAMTDYSLDSRMRHADFLILTKDYTALEKEANEMKKLDKVNPRILRYLGYSAYENGNDEDAIKAINEFLGTPNTKSIGRDYLYLGLAKTRKALTTTKAIDGSDEYKVDQTLFDSGVADMKKGVDMDPAMAYELQDIGKMLISKELFLEASSIFKVAVSNVNSINFQIDNYYLGYSLYLVMMKMPDMEKANDTIFDNAVKAFDVVLANSPTTQDIYIYKARLYNVQKDISESKILKFQNYEKYVTVVTDKNELNNPSNKSKLIEAYENIGAYYITLDKLKSKEIFEKLLLIDPNNEVAIDRMKKFK